MIAVGNIVAVDHPGGRVHGLLTLPVHRDQVFLLLTPLGAMHVVYYAACFLAGQRTPRREDLWAEMDPVEVERSCLELWKQESVKRAAQRVLRKTKAITPRTGGILESWELPMAMCVSGRPTELAPQLIRYIDSSPRDRSRMETALETLRDSRRGRGRSRGSLQQYEVYLACEMRGLPASWVAATWGVSRQSVWEMLQKARSFVDNYVAA